jgi:hypothetical protein
MSMMQFKKDVKLTACIHEFSNATRVGVARIIEQFRSIIRADKKKNTLASSCLVAVACDVACSRISVTK